MEGSVSLECMWRILNLNYAVVQCITSPIAITVRTSESWIFLSESGEEGSTPKE